MRSIVFNTILVRFSNMNRQMELWNLQIKTHKMWYYSSYNYMDTGYSSVKERKKWNIFYIDKNKLPNKTKMAAAAAASTVDTNSSSMDRPMKRNGSQLQPDLEVGFIKIARNVGLTHHYIAAVQMRRWAISIYVARARVQDYKHHLWTA